MVIGIFLMAVVFGAIGGAVNVQKWFLVGIFPNGPLEYNNSDIRQTLRVLL